MKHGYGKEHVKHSGEKHETRGLHHGGGLGHEVERPYGGRGHVQDGLKHGIHGGKGLTHHNVENHESHKQKLLHS